MKEYDKLVRGKIPAIIEDDGREAVTHTVEGEEYRQRLRAKLQEEVDEFLADNSPEELTDLIEVIYAICEAHGFDREDLEEMRRLKKEERGGFEEGVVLERAEGRE
jgi:predicted house-cleaning noncanonical NTP pyrophosphatase (MazG superfamily)